MYVIVPRCINIFAYVIFLIYFGLKNKIKYEKFHAMII
jgi:hypothetical protein